jgi:sialic acid synthase SpsE
MRETDILIGQRVIGSGSPVFVIDEIGINDSGSLTQAEMLIDAAAAAGADKGAFAPVWDPTRRRM